MPSMDNCLDTELNIILTFLLVVECKDSETSDFTFQI